MMYRSGWMAVLLATSCSLGPSDFPIQYTVVVELSDAPPYEATAGLSVRLFPDRTEAALYLSSRLPSGPRFSLLLTAEELSSMLASPPADSAPIEISYVSSSGAEVHRIGRVRFVDGRRMMTGQFEMPEWAQASPPHSNGTTSFVASGEFWFVCEVHDDAGNTYSDPDFKSARCSDAIASLAPFGLPWLRPPLENEQ